MLVPLERLLLRTRQVRSRADELVELRRRVRTEQRVRAADDERIAARDLRARKAAVSDALASVSSCGRCAAGKPDIRGVFAGGDCCTGVTAELFSDEEIAALVHGGTRIRDLRAPRSEHAGCAFRGATGCTLAAVDRPERCVSYTCSLLRRELRTSGELAGIERLLAELAEAKARFGAVRHARLERDAFEALQIAVDGALP